MLSEFYIAMSSSLLTYIVADTICYSILSMHLQHLQDTSERCRRDATTLWRTHVQQFASWLKLQASFSVQLQVVLLEWLDFDCLQYLLIIYMILCRYL